MKISAFALLLTTLITASSSIYACMEGDGHEYTTNGMSMRDTQELGFYDEIENLMNQRPERSFKTTAKNKKGSLSARLDMNFDGFDDGPQLEPFLGLPMRYPSFPNAYIAGTMGQATLHRGIPVVLWSIQDAEMNGSIVMGFFMQHEFAHHDLGHGRQPTNRTSAMREADADCNATKTLIAQGRGDVLQTIVQWFDMRGCNYDPRTPVTSVSDSHPCGTQRAQIIRECSRM